MMRDPKEGLPSAGRGDDSPTPPPKGIKERLYDKVNLPLWAVDLIIALLVAALLLTIYLGTRP